MFVCMKAWHWKNVEDNLALSFCFLLESLIFAILLDLDTPVDNSVAACYCLIKRHNLTSICEILHLAISIFSSIF